jgi:hypothetical protein
VNAQKDNSNNVSLIVKIDPNLAKAMHGRQGPSSKLKELFALEKELGIALKPVHPDATNHHLSPYFTMQVRDRSTAEKMIRRLKKYKAVEAAYFKPTTERAGGNNAVEGLP